MSVTSRFLLNTLFCNSNCRVNQVSAKTTYYMRTYLTIRTLTLIGMMEEICNDLAHQNENTCPKILEENIGKSFACSGEPQLVLNICTLNIILSFLSTQWDLKFDFSHSVGNLTTNRNERHVL